jgi:hypothetical protein
MRKVFRRIWRIHKIVTECAEKIYAYMETYMEIGEYSKFWVACGTQIFSECAEKIYAYMEKTQGDTKLRLSK